VHKSESYCDHPPAERQSRLLSLYGLLHIGKWQIDMMQCNEVQYHDSQINFKIQPKGKCTKAKAIVITLLPKGSREK
jgi:hypothetical protein